jgi:ParB/RepB/Spo0J family partition protein|nr:MAG TPA: ParB protein [Caudoviricetes sp.]
MDIVQKGLGELSPYENNPRVNDEAVDAVAASIKEFGFKVPIVIDAQGVIVAGHTRYRAAKKLGLEAVPCIVANDLSEEQIRAFRLADNKTAELASWDEERLAQELAEIADIDMTVFGFDEDDADLGDELLDNPYTTAPNSFIAQTMADKKDACFI